MKKQPQTRYSRLFSLALLASALPLAACEGDAQKSTLERPNGPGGQQPDQGGGGSTNDSGAATTDATGGGSASGEPGETGSTGGQDNSASSTGTTTTTTTSSTSTTSTPSDSATSSGDDSSSEPEPEPSDWMGDDFESTAGKWVMDKDGVWEIGAPDHPNGPGAHKGSKVIGTVLDGDYPKGEKRTRLLSPEFIVPKGESARIRYWQWFSLGDEDYAKVQLRVDGVKKVDDPEKGAINGKWIYQYSVVGNSRGRWVQVIIDMPKSYAGRRAQLAFELNTDSDDTRPGWFMDDFKVESGAMDKDSESFEKGWKDWSVQGGVWDIGELRNDGVPDAPDGKSVAGTDLSDDYPARDGLTTRLVSPRFTVPEDAKNPQATFQHWYRLRRPDAGEIQIREEHRGWETIRRGTLRRGGGKWREREINLRDYRGKSIQIGFRLDVKRDEGSAPGWFIDDFKLDLK